ncbi:MAG TPA: MFS transporter [Actinomycetota bacterium]|nr:MFS transporter [Actinomycetota bacterium]
MTAPRTAVRRFALARLISITGSAAAYTALMFEIYDRTGSAAWLAASLLVTEGLTGVVAPLTSILGDRFDRRKVMVWSDLAAAACFVGMSVAPIPGPLVFVALLSAFAEAPFWPASGAAIPNLVPEDQVSWANSLIAVGRNLGIMLGPAVGGLLLAAAGAPAVFLINAASFVISALLVVSVRGARFSGDRSDEEEHRGLAAGFRFLWREPVLRLLAIGWVVFVLGVGMAMVGDVPLVEVFDRGAGAYGVMIGLWGAGSVVGSLAGRKLKPSNEARWLVLGTGMVAVFALAVATSPWFAMVLALNLAWGAAEAVTNVADQNIMQRRSPDSVRSRVFGAQEGIWHGAISISYIGAAFVLPVVGARGMYAILGVTALLSAIVITPILRLDRPSDAVAEPEEPVLHAPVVPGDPPV